MRFLTFYFFLASLPSLERIALCHLCVATDLCSRTTVLGMDTVCNLQFKCHVSDQYFIGLQDGAVLDLFPHQMLAHGLAYRAREV